MKAQIRQITKAYKANRANQADQNTFKDLIFLIFRQITLKDKLKTIWALLIKYCKIRKKCSVNMRIHFQ